MNTKLKVIIICVIFVLGVFLGYSLGKYYSSKDKTTIQKETIKYVPSPYKVTDTIKKPIPYKTVDTVFLLKDIEIDTFKILHDYYLTRRYQLDFSNDTIGTFMVDAEVNENKLVNASSIIKPFVKTIYRTETNVITKVPTLQFYSMLGSSIDLTINKISFGLDLKQKYLIGVSGIRYKDDYNYTLDFGIKF